MKRDSESPMGAAPCDAPPTQTAPAGALSKGLRWVLERSSEPGECQFAASCSHLKADFCRVMPPPHLQHDAATSMRG